VDLLLPVLGGDKAVQRFALDGDFCAHGSFLSSVGWSVNFGRYCGVKLCPPFPPTLWRSWKAARLAHSAMLASVRRVLRVLLVRL
jgi:hypothetical protein